MNAQTITEKRHKEAYFRVHHFPSDWDHVRRILQQGLDAKSLHRSQQCFRRALRIG